MENMKIFLGNKIPNLLYKQGKIPGNNSNHKKITIKRIRAKNFNNKIININDNTHHHHYINPIKLPNSHNRNETSQKNQFSEFKNKKSLFYFKIEKIKSIVQFSIGSFILMLAPSLIVKNLNIPKTPQIAYHQISPNLHKVYACTSIRNEPTHAEILQYKVQKVN